MDLPLVIEKGALELQEPYCHYTEDEVTKLDELEEEARCRFPPSTNKYYQNVAELRTAIRNWSESRGASVTTQGSAIPCARVAAPASFQNTTEKFRMKNNIPVKKQRTSNQIRCGCKFRISFTLANRTIQDAPIKAVRITSGSYRHTDGCFPSQSQLIVDKKRGGTYTIKKIKCWL